MAFSVAGFLFLEPNLYLLEERLGTIGWTMAPDQELEERIVIVAIDEQSIAAEGPWPWPREKMAQLVRGIDAAGAHLQVHDIVFSESRPGDGDLIAALSEANNAVISQIPVLEANSDYPEGSVDIQIGVMTDPLAGFNCNGQQTLGFGFPDASSFIAANLSFSAISKGHITPLVNADGTISKQPAAICVEGSPYPALALAALQKASSLNANGFIGVPVNVERGGGFFAPPYELTLDSYPGLSIPLDSEGSFRVSYASHPSTYQAISASDVINGTADLSVLSGAWVLVGATAFGLDDVVPTPYSGSAPGVELQARILASIIDVEIPYTPVGAKWILGLFCLIFGATLIWLPNAVGRGAGFIPLLVFLFPSLSLLIHTQFLSALSIWLGWMFPSIFGCVAAASILLLEQARVRGQRNRVLANLASYLPSDAAEQIAYSLPSSNITAERRNVTLLSADLRNFSAYTEARPAEESAAVLHYFFQRATQIVENCQGRIYEFKGDGLIAVWDSQGAKSAQLAYRAATQMLEQINDQLLEEYAPIGLEPLVVGIGIEQGPALMGSIGPAHRRAQTLLGDTVTIALRVQEMTADLAQPLLFGECVARQLDSVELQSQGSYLLAGLLNPHTLFAPAPAKSRPREVKRIPKLSVLSGGRR
jgi:CHASE2 domain-containing sensor protein